MSFNFRGGICQVVIELVEYSRELLGKLESSSWRVFGLERATDQGERV